MKCPDDITVYNEITQTNRLYQFLVGLSDSFDKDRRDLINWDKLPTIEEAYAAIWREIARRGIMSMEEHTSKIGSGSAAKSRPERPSPWQPKQLDDKSYLDVQKMGALSWLPILNGGRTLNGMVVKTHKIQVARQLLVHQEKKRKS